MVIAFLMKEKGFTLKKALQYIIIDKGYYFCAINQGFLAQLLMF